MKYELTCYSKSICDNDNGSSQLDVIALVNVAWDLVQSQKDKRKKLLDQEMQVWFHHGLAPKPCLFSKLALFKSS